MKGNVINFLCRKPCGAKFGRSLCHVHSGVGQILFESASKCVRVDRVTVKEAAHQRDFRSKQMQPGSDSLGVFTKDTRTFLHDLIHTRVATGCGFKHHRS